MNPVPLQLASLILFAQLLYFIRYLRLKRGVSTLSEFITPSSFLAISGGVCVLAVLLTGAIGPRYALTALTLALGMVLSFAHPVVAVSFLVGNLIIRPWELMDPHPLMALIPKVLAAISLLSWIIFCIKNRRHRILWNSACTLFVLFVAWLFICQLFTSEPPENLQLIFDAFFPILVLSLLITNSVSDPLDIDALQGTVIVSITAIMVGALYLFYTDPLYGSSGELRLKGMGMVGNANDLGALIALGLPFALIPLIKRRLSLGGKLFHYASIAILLAALQATQSRGSIMSLGACGLAYFFAFGKKGIKQYAILLALVITAYVFMSTIKRDAEDLAGSKDSRWNYVIVGFRMLRVYPIFGVGINGYEKNYDRYTDNFYEMGIRTAHSSWVLAMAEAGALGAFLFISLFVAVFRRALRLRALRPEFFLAMVSYGVAMSFLSHTYLLFPYLLYSIIVAAYSVLEGEKSALTDTPAVE